jgi:hypothetical protein
MRKYLLAFLLLPTLAACSTTGDSSQPEESVAPTTESVSSTSEPSTSEPSTDTSTAETSASWTGGEYQVGDIGPGGGTVFYVSEKPFPCGETLKDECQYLELSPFDAEVELPWAAAVNQSADIEELYAVVGSGMVASLKIKAQTGNTASNSAAVYALEYTNNDFSDWYLPNNIELAEICKYATGVQAATEDGCPPSTSPAKEGFSAGKYWSSTEAADTATKASTRAFKGDPYADSDLGQFDLEKSELARVRPIRAF